MHERCILARLKVPQRRRTGGRWQIPGVHAVFYRDRKAMQRTQRSTGMLPAVAFPRGGQHLLRPLGDEGIETSARLTPGK